jgi:hypothetical protein
VLVYPAAGSSFPPPLDTLFLLAVIAWVVMPQVGNLPLWCSALAAGVLLWRGWLAWTSRPLPGAGGCSACWR